MFLEGLCIVRGIFIIELLRIERKDWRKYIGSVVRDSKNYLVVLLDLSIYKTYVPLPWN